MTKRRVPQRSLPCTVEGCESPRTARGLCQRHRRHALQGRPLSSARSIHSRLSEDDFWLRVNKSETCWEWTASLTQAGYGKVQMPHGKTGTAHRRSYEIANGQVPDGLVIDHLCRNKKCVRPDHLEAVTVRENTVRGATSLDFSNMCRAGLHDLSADAGIVTFGSGKRTCVECKRIGEKRRSVLIKRAASRLGMPTYKYVKQYGGSQRVAIEVLGEDDEA